MKLMRRARFKPLAFTLVELLVVIGVIALLLALLLSAVQAARRQANLITCAANLGNIAKALLAYANDQGAFPPNTAAGTNTWWSEEAILGPYATYNYSGPYGASFNGMVCAEDDGSVRSYAMNFWASSLVDVTLSTLAPANGEFWKPSATPSSQLMLVVESYSANSEGPGWNYAPAYVGQRGSLAAQRFGQLGGVPPYRLWSRVFVTTQLEWRHGRLTDPRINLAFADGHVKSFTQSDLARPDGSLTGEAYWSPSDR